METTVIAQLAAQPLTRAPAEAVQSLPPADEVTAARFAEMMKPVAPTDDPSQASRVAGSEPSKPRTLGESILEGMNHLSHEFDETRRAVRATLDPGAKISFNDALRLQLTLAELSIQNELVGKAISRSTQNIDQLVKMQ